MTQRKKAVCYRLRAHHDPSWNEINKEKKCSPGGTGSLPQSAVSIIYSYPDARSGKASGYSKDPDLQGDALELKQRVGPDLLKQRGLVDHFPN